jgi:phosphoribosylformylglycinamidine (FGAM) synthase PurS component
VRVGRLVELETDRRPERLQELCERLLCNTLIEEFEIVEVEP